MCNKTLTSSLATLYTYHVYFEQQNTNNIFLVSMVALVGRYMSTAARHKHITGVLNMSDHKYMYIYMYL